tara:strand:+ start:312 stop:779 length:468 start_codon:yes stop_codon:yes gene_type:complete
MAVDVRIKSNVKSIQRNFDKFFNKFPSITRKGLARASFRLQSIIKELTSKEQDFRRRRFAPYSDQYLKRLQKEGKSQKVDLFFTGRMLGSITGKVKSSRKATVFFNNAEMRQRALFNQVLNEPKREFFGFDNRTEKLIKKEFVQFMEKEIRKMRL